MSILPARLFRRVSLLVRFILGIVLLLLLATVLHRPRLSSSNPNSLQSNPSSNFRLSHSSESPAPSGAAATNPSSPNDLRRHHSARRVHRRRRHHLHSRFPPLLHSHPRNQRHSAPLPQLRLSASFPRAAPKSLPPHSVTTRLLPLRHRHSPKKRSPPPNFSRLRRARPRRSRRVPQHSARSPLPPLPTAPSNRIPRRPLRPRLLPPRRHPLRVRNARRSPRQLDFQTLDRLATPRTRVPSRAAFSTPSRSPGSLPPPSPSHSISSARKTPRFTPPSSSPPQSCSPKSSSQISAKSHSPARTRNSKARPA